MRDLIRAGLRLVADRPWLSLSAVAALVATVGAVSASAALALALRGSPLGVVYPGTIAVVTSIVRPSGGGPGTEAFLSYAAAQRLRPLGMVAMELAAAERAGDVIPQLWSAQLGRHVRLAVVSADYFNVLGVPVAGPGFADGDDVGTRGVVVIATRQFVDLHRTDKHTPGAPIVTIGELRIPVVGTIDGQFTGTHLGDSFEVWLPMGSVQLLRQIPADLLGVLPVRVFHRLLGPLRPGGDPPPDWERLVGRPLHVTTLVEGLSRSRSGVLVVRDREAVRTALALGVVMSAAGILTLVNLVLMRLEIRRPELRTRFVLGASRTRLALAAIGEWWIVIALGAVGAIVLVGALIRALREVPLPSGILIGSLNRLGVCHVWPLVLIAIGVVGAVGFLWAWRASRRWDHRGAPGFGGNRGRLIAVTVHVALSTGLVGAAGVLVAAIMASLGVQAGYAVDRTWSLTVQPRVMQYANEDLTVDEARRSRDLRRLVDEIRAIPGVHGAALGSNPAVVAEEPSQMTSARFRGSVLQLAARRAVVGSRYFQTTGIPVLAGRGFVDGEQPDGGPKVIVSLSVARLLSSEPAGVIGETIDLGPWGQRVIEAVVGDVTAGRSVGESPVLYLPWGTDSDNGRWAFVLNAEPAAEMADAVRRTTLAQFPDPADFQLVSSAELVRVQLAGENLASLSLSWYAACSMTLLVGGLFGLTADLTRQRRREWCVRIALGASEHSVMRQALRLGIYPTVMGTAIGAVGLLVVWRATQGTWHSLLLQEHTWMLFSAAVVPLVGGVSALTAVWSLREIGRKDVVAVLQGGA